MKCPYMADQKFQRVEQTTYEYDEEGRYKVVQTVVGGSCELRDCLEAECAAWNGTRCTYNGDFPKRLEIKNK